MNDTNTVSTKIYQSRHTTGENRQRLSQLLDTRVSENRLVSIGQSQRIGYVGGQIFKVRLPDIGETGLSEAEIDHAMTHGVSA